MTVNITAGKHPRRMMHVSDYFGTNRHAEGTVAGDQNTLCYSSYGQCICL